MKKVFQFFALVVVITLTSCSSTAKPEKSLLVQKSTNGEFITIQKMNSVEKDTIPTDMISLQNAKKRYKFEKDFESKIAEMKNQETSRYVFNQRSYLQWHSGYIENNYDTDVAGFLIKAVIFIIVCLIAGSLLDP